MDNETKILIEKLIEAIDSPDWWIIILTVINIIAFIFVAITQIKLQKQQVQQQEYAIYRQMYINIDNIDTFAQTFLQKVVAVLSCQFGNNERVFKMRELFKEAYTLNDSFTESTFDIELKECGDVMDVGCYYGVLSEIKRLSKTLEFLLETNKMKFTHSQIEYNTDYTTLLNTIINCCIDKQFQGILKTQLQECVDAINKLKTSSIKEEIKKRITSK